MLSPYSIYRLVTTLVVILSPAWLCYYFVQLVPEVSSGKTLQLVNFPWISVLGIDFALVLNSFSLLFSLLICAIGLLIQLYSLSYISDPRKRARLQWLLFFFMLAMLGLVLADNLMVVFVFWELTSLSSYLLIGFNHRHEVVRQNAQQALLITSLGALFMLAGFILLGEVAGSYNLSELTEINLADQGLLPSLILLCILLGCLTKSAQFPWHFWLPNAMNAPTPVSAYLHSATMVKAGIFLLARFWPIFHDHMLWTYVLVGLGVVTVLFSAVLALRQYDLKLKLAYTTLTILGQCAILLGVGSTAALAAFVVLITAHAFYKASLFLVVGVIDHKTGTRHVHELRKLVLCLPLTALAAAFAGLSNAGIPPSLGFISKEMIYTAFWEAQSLSALSLGLIPVFILSNAAMVAITLLVAFYPFYAKASNKRKSHALKTEILNRKWYLEPNPLLWFAPLFLGAAGLLIFMLKPLWELLLFPAASLISGDSSLAEQAAPALWHGLNWPVAFSLVTLSLGALVYYYHHPIRHFLENLEQKLQQSIPGCEKLYFAILNSLNHFAQWQTYRIQRGFLARYIFIIFGFLTFLFGYIVFDAYTNTSVNTSVIQIQHLLQNHSQPAFYTVAIIIMAIMCTFAVILLRSRLAVICALGAIGFLIALLFLLHSAPDVAMTQFLVETLLVVIIVVVMRYLPPDIIIPPYSKWFHGFRIFMSVSLAIALGLLILSLSKLHLPLHISDYFIENSWDLGQGKNIVNVILVNFRALDTMGEISVVMLAGLAALILIKRFGQPIANTRRIRRKRL